MVKRFIALYPQIIAPIPATHILTKWPIMCIVQLRDSNNNQHSNVARSRPEVDNVPNIPVITTLRQFLEPVEAVSKTGSGFNI